VIAAYVCSLVNWLGPCPASNRSCVDASNNRADADDGEEKLHGGLIVVWFPVNASRSVEATRNCQAG
jgi:hypothetical protein